MRKQRAFFGKSGFAGFIENKLILIQQVRGTEPPACLYATL